MLQVFAAYKSGVNALRSIQKPQSLEKAEDLLDDLKELAEDAANISAVLSEGGLCVHVHCYMCVFVCIFVCAYVGTCVCVKFTCVCVVHVHLCIHV